MRRGVALPVVLFAIATTSALAVGGTYLTRQYAAAVRTTRRQGELEPAAERALVEVVATWDSVARSEQLVGAVVALPPVSTASARSDVWITRISARAYWLVAEASTGVKPPLRRRIGVLVRVSEEVPALVSDRAWSELP